jgi:hypothetical protein
MKAKAAVDIEKEKQVIHNEEKEYTFVCVYGCVPMLLVIIIRRAIARSSSFTPSLGLSFMTSLPKDEATIDPLKFIPSSSWLNRMERNRITFDC